jgi:hypothetical protein
MSRVNVGEHLHAFHKASHADRAAAIAGNQAALEKAAAMEPGGGPRTTFHKAEIARHQVMLDHHAEKMAECEKTVTSDLEKSQQLEPRIAGVIPDVPLVRPVIRTGQREFTTSVPADFSKIIGINPEDQDAAEPSLK